MDCARRGCRCRAVGRRLCAHACRSHTQVSPLLRVRQIGGYGLSAGQTTLLCCVVAWAVVVCCLLERRTVGRSNGLLSLLEEVERLKNEGADLSLDEVAEEEEPAFDPSKLSEEELKMLLETSSRNLDD